MVAVGGKKKSASSNVTLEGNKAAENGLPESHSDSLTVVEIEPNEDAQSEDEQGKNADNGEMSGEEGKNLYHEQRRYAYDGEMSREEGDKKDDEHGMNADYGEMYGEEGEKVTGVYHEDLCMPGTGTNGDNKAEFGGNTFEDDEIGDQEEDEEGPFEHDNEDRFLDEFEVSEEETTEEDDVDDDDEVSEEDAGEDDEVTEEKGHDKVSEEATKVKNDKDKAKVKQDGREAKKHDRERSGASSKNIMLSNEKSRKKRVQASRLKKGDSEDKPESSRKTEVKKRVQSMGMIFMCTSKTKKDCYQYRVLGLPESKKGMVEKIYTGMRLFLYDIDLRLMYGIYKAAGPGGYNIEPKAFRSQFPSQVRFKVMENCLPLAEESFKMAIKENYVTKSRFDCLLNSEQVKKLCKLFTRKERSSKKLGPGLKAEKQPIPRERNRSNRSERNRRQITRDKKRLPPLREEVRRHERPRKRPRKGTSPVPLPRQHLPPPLPSTIPSSYVYDRVSDAYRRDPYVERRSPYRDRRDRPLSPINGGAQDPPIERGERYRDVRDLPPLDHRYTYVVPRDPYTDGVGSYPRTHDPYRDRRAPYLESRDLYGERRDPYRDGRDLYVETPHSLRDGQASYYGEGARSELYSTYVRPPLSDGRDVYGNDRGIDFRDSYRRDELLGRRDTHLINSETRNNYVSSRGRPLYDETLYPAEAYPSRAALYRL